MAFLESPLELPIFHNVFYTYVCYLVVCWPFMFFFLIVDLTNLLLIKELKWYPAGFFSLKSSKFSDNHLSNITSFLTCVNYLYYKKFYINLGIFLESPFVPLIWLLVFGMLF